MVLGTFAHIERIARFAAAGATPFRRPVLRQPDQRAATRELIGVPATESAPGRTDALRWVFATDGAGQEGAPT